MHNQITIADVTGSRGCHNDDDKRRAIEAAEEVLKDTDAVEAMLAYIARIDDEPHDTALADIWERAQACLLYTSPSPRDRQKSRMPSSA